MRAFAIVKAETRDFAEISAVDADAWGGDPCMVDGQYAWRVFVEHAHVWVARCLNSEKIVAAVLRFCGSAVADQSTTALFSP